MSLDEVSDDGSRGRTRRPGGARMIVVVADRSASVVAADVDHTDMSATR
ncbi:hypothetical protein AB0I54_06935 [Streptomyces sp. NPDC050625]